MSKTKIWIEAMRLRTLPVSVAGVVMGAAMALMCGGFKAIPVALCLIFAILAQIASNFANEYYDYKAGLDAPGREGPRRGVTEGDITPGAMKTATFLTLALACAAGLGLVVYGGWWLVAAGIAIVIAALAYSSGPYPLSHHGWGEVAVILFFGFVPVNLTFYVQTLHWDLSVLFASFSVGLMGANVLIVNNYRDCDADRSVGKRTLAVILGRRVMSTLYLFNGFIAVALMLPLWMLLPPASWIVPGLYLVAHTAIWWRMSLLDGRRLNPLLGMTATAMALYALGMLITAIAII